MNKQRKTFIYFFLKKKKKKEELRKMNLKSNVEIEKLKESDNEKSKEIQQLKQCQSAFDIRIIKLEEILKSNNYEQCKQIAKLSDEIKQLKSEKELNEKKQNEKISKINHKNLILKQELVLFVYVFPFHINISFNDIYQIDIQSKYQINKDKKEKDYNNQLLQFKYSQSYTLENKIQIIIRHWIRILQIKFGWIHEFDKLVVNYVYAVFMFDTFCSSSKLTNTFTGHTNWVRSIDYSTFDDCQFICSGSDDNTVRVWDIDKNKQIQSFNGHSSAVHCVKFSSYHYHYHRQNVICSSSFDKTIRLWDFKHNKELQIFNGHDGSVNGIEFSPFNGGRYLCSGSGDKTIRLWDVETSKSLYIFKGHEDC
ncbi:WD-40 repeat protein, partial [Reticulomyxa filosa]